VCGLGTLASNFRGPGTAFPLTLTTAMETDQAQAVDMLRKYTTEASAASTRRES